MYVIIHLLQGLSPSYLLYELVVLIATSYVVLEPCLVFLTRYLPAGCIHDTPLL